MAGLCRHYLCAALVGSVLQRPAWWDEDRSWSAWMEGRPGFSEGLRRKLEQGLFLGQVDVSTKQDGCRTSLAFERW